MPSNAVFHAPATPLVPVALITRIFASVEATEPDSSESSDPHVDFLIYSRLGKKPILAIEVDGYEYHQAESKQAFRDSKKNHIFELYKIPLLRFCTNGSGEKQQIIEKLEEVMG